MKLTQTEKVNVREALRTRCGGTELQPYADLVADYLGIYVIQLVENRDSVFLRPEVGDEGSHRD